MVFLGHLDGVLGHWDGVLRHLEGCFRLLEWCFQATWMVFQATQNGFFFVIETELLFTLSARDNFFVEKFIVLEAKIEWGNKSLGGFVYRGNPQAQWALDLASQVFNSQM